MNHYVWLKDQGIDYRFWSLFHYEFNNSVLYTKDEYIVPMKYIDWQHIKSIETPVSGRVIQTVADHGIKDIMGFKCA